MNLSDIQASCVRLSSQAFLLLLLLTSSVVLASVSRDAAARDLIADKEYVRLEKLIRDTPAERMNQAWLIDQVYKGFENPQPYLKQILGNTDLQAKNTKMARLRQAIDLKFWAKMAREKGWHVELTNQGKTKGHRSDLDQTGWVVMGPEGNRPASFEEVRVEWKVYLEGLGFDPSKPDMTLFNGDEFIPDWKNAKTGAAEFVVELAGTVLKLREDAEAYYVPSANKEQVHTRALNEGRTMHVAWDHDLGMMVVNGRPLDLDEFIRGEADIHYLPTRDIAFRYFGVNAAEPWRNAVGNLAQNMRNYLTHAHDPLSRQKYGNRIVDGAFARVIGIAQRDAMGDLQTYYKIHTSEKASPEQKRTFKDMFIRQLYGGANPEAMSRNRVDELRQIFDASADVEADKGLNLEYNAEKYYAPWLQEAGAELRRTHPELRGAELRRQAWAKAEQIYIQKQLAAIVEGSAKVLKHALVNDMTEEGRQRHRRDFGTDPEAIKVKVQKMLAERQVEIALLFEVVEQMPDTNLRDKLRNDLLDAAPNTQLRGMLEDLSNLARAGRQAVDDWLLAASKRGELPPPDEFYNKLSDEVEDIVKTEIDDAAEQTTRARAKQWMRQKAILLLGPLEGGKLNKVKELAAEAASQAGAFKEWYWKEFINGFDFFFYANTATGLIKAYEDHCLKRGVGGSDCGYAVASQMATDFAWGLPVMDKYGTAVFAVIQINRGDSGGFFTLPLVGAKILGVGAGALQVYAVYKLAEGVYDISYGYVMYTIEEDILEQALKALPEPGKMARRCGPRRGVGGGDTPQFPIFHDEIDVPANGWSLDQRLAAAQRQFAVPINHELIREGFVPQSQAWRDERGKRIHKYACLLPYFQRIGKIFTHFKPEVERYIESAKERGRTDFDDTSHPAMHVCVQREREDREKKRAAAERQGKKSLRDYDEAAAKLPSPIAVCLPRGLEEVSPVVRAFFARKIDEWLGKQPEWYRDAFSTTVEQTTSDIPFAQDLRGAYEWVGSYLGWDTRPLRSKLLKKVLDVLVREYVLNQYLYYEREEAKWELERRMRGAAALTSRAEILMRAIQTGNREIGKKVIDAIADGAARNFTRPNTPVTPKVRLILPKHPVRLGTDAPVDANVVGEHFPGEKDGPRNQWSINLKTMPLGDVQEGAPEGMVVTEEIAKLLKNEKNAIYSIKQTVVAELTDKDQRVIGKSEPGEIIWFDIRHKPGDEEEETTDEPGDQPEPDETPAVDLSGILSQMRAAETSATGATGQANAACTAAENMIAEVEQALPGMEAQLAGLQRILNIWRPAITRLNAVGDKADQLTGDAKKAATRAREHQKLAERIALAACERLREINRASEEQRKGILAAIVSAVQACKAHARTVGQAAQDAKGAAAACNALTGALDALKPAQPLPAEDASKLRTAATDAQGKLDAANAAASAASTRIAAARGFKGQAAELNKQAATLVAGIELTPELTSQLAEMSAIVTNIDKAITDAENCPDDVTAAAQAIVGRQDTLRAAVETAAGEIATFDAALKNDSHRIRVQEGIEQSGNYAEIADWALQGTQQTLVSVATCQATAERLIAQANARDREQAQNNCNQQFPGTRVVRHPSGSGWACQCPQPGAVYDRAQRKCVPRQGDCQQLESQFFGLLMANRIQQASDVLSKSGHCGFAERGNAYIRDRICLNFADQFRAAYQARNFPAAAAVLARARPYRCDFIASAAGLLNQTTQPPPQSRPPTTTTRRPPSTQPTRPPTGGGCAGRGTGVLLLCQEAEGVD